MKDDAIRPVVSIVVNKLETNSFIDSGSSVTLIKPTVAEILVSAGNLKVKTCKNRLSSATNHDIETLGVIELKFLIGKRIYRHNVIICEGTSFPGGILIGTDLLGRLGFISFEFSRKIM